MTATRDHRTREEIAAEELGHTDVSPAVARFLIVAFLLLVTAVPVTQLVIDLRNPGPLQVAQVRHVLPTGEEIARADSLDGLLRTNARMLRDITRWEDDLKDNSFLQDRLLPPAQAVVTGWLEGGNEKAYCGRDRWLFYRPGIDYVTGRGFLAPELLEDRRQAGNEWTPPPQPDPVRAIVDFRDQLAARGVELIVMPTPVKPQIHPEKFSARFTDADLPLRNPSFAEFARRLRDAGVAAYDPAEDLVALRRSGGEPVYLETDTHWTPPAMQTVAARLAERVKARGGGQGDPVAYRIESDHISGQGDIAAMLRLPDWQTFYLPQRVQIARVRTPAGESWSPDPDADVLLLGDSFSNIYSLGGMGWGDSAGLAEHLSASLGRPVDRIVINDNGACASRQGLAAEMLRGRDRLAGKRVIVWQFAARELLVGDWKLIELKLGEARTQPQPVTAAEGLVIEAKVAAMARPPVPGQVPYKDATIAIHLTDIRTISGAFAGDPPDEILAYAWVMRDNELTSTANYRTGQTVKLRLTPWQDVQSKVGGYNRLELDDPMLLMLDPWWAEPR